MVRSVPARHRGSSTAKWLILVLLLCIIGGSVGYYALTNKTFDNGKPPASDSSSVPTSDKPTPPQPVIDATLSKKFKQWTADLPGTYAISLQEISGNHLRSASFNDELSMVPASSYKLYVAYAVLLDIQNGKRSLSDMTSNGTIDDCLTRMIVNSDNEAGRALGFLLGWQNINRLLKEQGMTHTDLNNYIGAGTPQPTGDKHTTAKDMTLLLARLAEGRLLNKTYTAKLLGLMKTQKWRERIPAGVPTDVVVADKPGWLPGIQTDAAIVYAPSGTFVLVILSTANTPAPIVTLTSHIYSYLSS